MVLCVILNLKCQESLIDVCYILYIISLTICVFRSKFWRSFWEYPCIDGKKIKDFNQPLLIKLQCIILT